MSEVTNITSYKVRVTMAVTPWKLQYGVICLNNGLDHSVDHARSLCVMSQHSPLGSLWCSRACGVSLHTAFARGRTTSNTA
jgi:hypothetical protein